MDVGVLSQRLEEIFDHAVLYHGFTDYLRDYELIAHMSPDPGSGQRPVYLRYLFRYCVEARCRTILEPRIWRASLDERLIDYETGVDLDGYVWGVKWQENYPGARVVADSEPARRWTDEVGIDFHEVRLAMNAHELALVFSDLEVAEPPPGYTPYAVPDDRRRQGGTWRHWFPQTD